MSDTKGLVGIIPLFNKGHNNSKTINKPHVSIPVATPIMPVIHQQNTEKSAHRPPQILSGNPNNLYKTATTTSNPTTNSPTTQNVATVSTSTSGIPKLLSVIPQVIPIASPLTILPIQSLKPMQTTQQNVKQNVNQHTQTGPSKTTIVETTADVILKSMSLIEDLKPTLCSHLYAHLFSDEDEDEKKKKEELNASVILTMTKNKVDYRKFFEEHLRSLGKDSVMNILKISKDFKKYIDTHLKNDKLTNYLPQDEDVSKNYDITKKENLDVITSISKKNFLDLILETYPDDSSIIRQFLLDLPRHDVYLNGSKVTSIDRMFLELSNFNRDITIDDKSNEKSNEKSDSNANKKVSKRKIISLMMLVTTLICQSSFFVSFMHLHNKYLMMQSVIESMTEQDESYEFDFRRNVHVADHRERNVIDLTVNQTTMKCSFVARYKVFDIKTEKILFVVKTETLFDIDNDSCLIIYEATPHNK